MSEHPSGVTRHGFTVCLCAGRGFMGGPWHWARQVVDGDEVIFNLGAVEPLVFAIGLVDGIFSEHGEKQHGECHSGQGRLVGRQSTQLEGLGGEVVLGASCELFAFLF